MLFSHRQLCTFSTEILRAQRAIYWRLPGYCCCAERRISKPSTYNYRLGSRSAKKPEVTIYAYIFICKYTSRLAMRTTACVFSLHIHAPLTFHSHVLYCYKSGMEYQYPSQFSLPKSRRTLQTTAQVQHRKAHPLKFDTVCEICVNIFSETSTGVNIFQANKAR